MVTRKNLSQAIADLTRVFGPQRVLHTPEDLLVFEYDGTIERAASGGHPAEPSAGQQ